MPNLFRACRQKNIPLLLVNARLSERSLAGYRRFGRLIDKTLEAVTQIAARTPLDAERFRALGADPDRIKVSGDLKFEQHLPAGLYERAALLRQEWGVNRHVWIAGHYERPPRGRVGGHPPPPRGAGGEGQRDHGGGGEEHQPSAGAQRGELRAEAPRRIHGPWVHRVGRCGERDHTLRGRRPPPARRRNPPSVAAGPEAGYYRSRRGSPP